MGLRFTGIGDERRFASELCQLLLQDPELDWMRIWIGVALSLSFEWSFCYGRFISCIRV